MIQHPVYVNQDDLAKMAAEMDKGQGRHEDIPEEDEEEEVTTPTAQYHGDTISSSQHHGEGKAQPGVSSVPSQVRLGTCFIGDYGLPIHTPYISYTVQRKQSLPRFNIVIPVVTNIFPALPVDIHYIPKRLLCIVLFF